MKRIVAAVTTALALASPVVASAQNKPDFSGMWSFSQSITPVAERERAPFSTLIIKQSPTEISMEQRSMQQEQGEVVFRLDGSESTSTNEAGVTTGRAVWQGPRLLITGSRTYKGPQGDVTVPIKDVYSLEKDVLMIDRVHQFGERAFEDRFAYTRGPFRQPPMPANTSTKPGPDGSCPPDSTLFKACAMEKLKTYSPPRSADGKPDLDGYWRIAGELTGTTPGHGIEAQATNPLWPGGRSMIIDPPDGIIPYQPWAIKDQEWRRRSENAILDTLVVSCNAGIPRTYTYSQNHWIKTKDGYLVLYEMHHDYRFIAMDGTPPLRANVNGLWRGSSRGRWEGDTLVVETENLNGKQYVDMAFVPQSTAMKLVERFTRVADDQIWFEVTFTDPKLYTRPWTMSGVLQRNAQPNMEILESACNEDNRELSSEGAMFRYSDFPRIKREAETRPHLEQ